MIGAMQNAIRLQAQRAAAENETSRLATVFDYNPNTYQARVTILPEGLVTGWLPIASPWVGNAWGLFCPPSIGDQVSLSFFEGNIETGYVESRFWNTVALPVAVPSGEFWLLHKSGSLLKFTNDGKVALTTNSDFNLTVGGAFNATSTGAVTLNSNAGVTINGVAINSSGSVSGAADVQTTSGISLKNHVHTGVQSGSSSTGAATG